MAELFQYILQNANEAGQGERNASCGTSDLADKQNSKCENK